MFFIAIMIFIVLFSINKIKLINNKMYLTGDINMYLPVNKVDDIRIDLYNSTNEYHVLSTILFFTFYLNQ